MQKYTSLETKRLRLIPASKDFAPFALKLMNSPKWIEFIGQRNIHTVEDAEKYIEEKMLPQFERLGFGNYYVVEKFSGETLGACGLYTREGLESVDIGFAFLEEYEGKGFAYEAASKIMQEGIEQFGLTSICAITTPENKSSQKLIEKLGLRFKEIINLPDDPVDLMLYEWKK